VPDRILELSERLAEFSERGTFPKELRPIGFREYRRVHFDPYRLIYRTTGSRVFVSLIADGRSDFQSPLAKRLLETE
jgi:toxin ParE1/3/4